MSKLRFFDEPNSKTVIRAVQLVFALLHNIFHLILLPVIWLAILFVLNVNVMFVHFSKGLGTLPGGLVTIGLLMLAASALGALLPVALIARAWASRIVLGARMAGPEALFWLLAGTVPAWLIALFMPIELWTLMVADSASGFLTPNGSFGWSGVCVLLIMQGLAFHHVLKSLRSDR